MNDFPVHLQWGLRIPLRDGAHVSALLYGPRAPSAEAVARRPILVAITPYVAQSLHETGVYFASHGYPFLAVDLRGRGNSDGEFRANGSEAQDAHDIVEWAAQQSCCDGRVAMWGGSYSGFVQWGAASAQARPLKTIVPVASCFRGVDSPAPSNIFLPYRIQWLTAIAGAASQEKIFADQAFWNQQYRRWFESGRPFRDIDRMLGHPSETFQEWLAHPQRDAYWDAYNPTPEQYAQIDLPILTITGAYDANQLGALTHYRQHLKHASPKARHYLIIGPWDHAGTRDPKAAFAGITIGSAGVLDLGQLHREWYAWTLDDGSKPAFLQKRVAYYVAGAERWRYADTLDGITTRHEPLYLSSRADPTDVLHSGLLVRGKPVGNGQDRYHYDPRDIGHAALESMLDPANVTEQRLVYARSGKHLVYHSAPFEEPVEISGFFKLIVWLAIDQPDTDFQAAIYAIGLDGRSILLARDVMRARYRESLHEARLVTTSEPLLYEFGNFGFISRQMARGSRLRLIFGPINSIFSEKNYNSGGIVSEESMADARTVTVTLFHDAQRPSALYVPRAVPEEGRPS